MEDRLDGMGIIPAETNALKRHITDLKVIRIVLIYSNLSTSIGMVVSGVSLVNGCYVNKHLITITLTL